MLRAKHHPGLWNGLLGFLSSLSFPVLGPSIAHVDVNAAPGGDGTSPSNAFQTVTEGVAEASERPGRQTVEIAPADYDERETVIRCAAVLHGQTKLEALGEALLRIVSSRTRVEGILFRPKSALGVATTLAGV